MESESRTTVQVASLNCWNLYISKDRRARVDLLISYFGGILTGDLERGGGGGTKQRHYDVIGLQEVWIRSDYERIKAGLAHLYPYSYYFKSGVMGSGLATFSRHPILQAGFRRFTLNGYAHRIFHADWYSGKGIAYCRINLHGGLLKMDFYNTHMHAEYNHLKAKNYLAHRLCQFQEIIQFVQTTSATTDRSPLLGGDYPQQMADNSTATSSHHLSVIVGDFNTPPDDLPYRIFVQHAILSPPKTRLRDTDDTQWPPSFNLHGNKYATAKKPSERLDYIFYLANPAVQVIQGTVLAGCLEDNLLSDHNPVIATFAVNNDHSLLPVRETDGTDPDADLASHLEMAKEASDALQLELAACRSMQRFFLVAAVVTLILFIGLSVAFSFLALYVKDLPIEILLLLFTIAPGLLLGAVVAAVLSRILLSQDGSTLEAFANEWQLILATAANRP